MKPSCAAILGVCLIAGVAEARPLPDPAPWVLPVNVYGKAKAGDWTILEGDALLNGKLVHEREIIRVGPVKGGVAEVQMFEGKAGQEGWFLSFPVDTKRGPDSNLVFDLPWVTSDLKQTATTCTLGGTSFPCTEITYQTKKHQVTVRMAPRVRGSGIVSFAITHGDKPYWTMTAIGYGSGRKVEWGEGPPRADLEVWDGGAQPTRMREGTDPATPDVYESPADAMRADAPHADLSGCNVSSGKRAPAVRRLVAGKLSSMEDCYSDALASHPRIGGGTIEVTFGLDNGTPVDITGSGTNPAAQQCATDAMGAMELSDEDNGFKVTCTFVFDPGRRATGTRSTKRRLLTKAHPARGGPDLRGLARVP